MSEEKKQDKTTKVYTEPEYLKKVTDELYRIRSQHVTYTIKNDIILQTGDPSFTLEIRGGDIENLRKLSLDIESMVIDFIKDTLKYD